MFSNTNCCVPQCCSRRSKNPELSFHLFPKDRKRRLEWIIKLRIGSEVSNRMTVCSKHFVKFDYILPDISKKRPHLKKIAVPSQYLPLSSTDKEKSSHKRGRLKKKKFRNIASKKSLKSAEKNKKNIQEYTYEVAEKLKLEESHAVDASFV